METAIDELYSVGGYIDTVVEVLLFMILADTIMQAIKPAQFYVKRKKWFPFSFWPFGLIRNEDGSIQNMTQAELNEQHEGIIFNPTN